MDAERGLNSSASFISPGPVSDFLGCCEPDLTGAGKVTNANELPGDPATFGEQLFKTRFAGSLQTAIRARPLTRRRFSTLRPSVVRMRMRNP
jgi:hypothetical protein